MGLIERKLEAMGLVLPAASNGVPEVDGIYSNVRVRGDRAYVAGHGPEPADGPYAGPFGQVGVDLTVEEGREVARLTALSMLGSLKRELGELDRVTYWIRVFGMVNSAPGFDRHPEVINGFTELIVEVWGPQRGMASRSAVGVTGLGGGIPVEIEAEVEIDGG